MTTASPACDCLQLDSAETRGCRAQHWDGYACSRPHGHSGLHRACGNDSAGAAVHRIVEWRVLDSSRGTCGVPL